MYSNIKSTAMTALTAIRTEHDNLIDESNALAVEARALIAKVQRNIEKQNALKDIMHELNLYADLSTKSMTIICDNIKDALKDLNEGEVPEIDDISEFEGYCEDCGEVMTTDNCNEHEGALICSNCLADREAEAEDNTDEEDAAVEA